MWGVYLYEKIKDFAGKELKVRDAKVKVHTFGSKRREGDEGDAGQAA